MPEVAPAGTVTVIGEPVQVLLSPPFLIPSLGVPPPFPLSLNAFARLFEVVVYGAVPPVIVKLRVPPLEDGTDTVAGKIVNVVVGAVTTTVVVPDLPPTDAVTDTFVTAVTVGAVNVVVATPSFVWANGLPSDPAVAVKFTVVPSGTGVPRLVVTYADMVDEAPDATVAGLAETATELTVTGFRKRLTILNEPFDAVALILTTDEVKDGVNFTNTKASLFVFKVAINLSDLPSGNVTAVVLSGVNVTVPPRLS